MRRTFKIQTGSGALERSVPTGWDNMTVREYAAYRNNTGEVNFLANVLGFEEVVVQRSPASVFDNIRVELSFVGVPIDLDKIKIGEKISISGKEYPTPKYINFDNDFSYGQMIEMENVIKSHIVQKEIEEEGEKVNKSFFQIWDAVAEILSVWYFEPMTGKDLYRDEWKELVPLMEELPVMEAYPIANFFLKRLKILKRPGVNYSMTEAALQTKVMSAGQGLNRYLASVFLRLYIHLQKVTLPRLLGITGKV